MNQLHVSLQLLKCRMESSIAYSLLLHIRSLSKLYTTFMVLCWDDNILRWKEINLLNCFPLLVGQINQVINKSVGNYLFSSINLHFIPESFSCHHQDWFNVSFGYVIKILPLFILKNNRIIAQKSLKIFPSPPEI